MVMQLVTGTVVDGKVVLDGVTLPEGTVVAVLARNGETVVTLPPDLQKELEEAIDEADQGDWIPGEELSEQLKSRR
jgi:hypothetical protein